MKKFKFKLVVEGESSLLVQIPGRVLVPVLDLSPYSFPSSTSNTTHKFSEVPLSVSSELDALVQRFADFALAIRVPSANESRHAYIFFDGASLTGYFTGGAELVFTGFNISNVWQLQFNVIILLTNS